MDAYEVLLARRSIRRFTAQDVSLEDERRLIAAAFAAPSSNNGRPWHFVVVRDADSRERLAQLHVYASLLRRAPLVIAVLGRADSTQWVVDCAAATENILTAATALGLGACWVGIWDDVPGVDPCETECLASLGAAPDKWRALCLVGIGHPAEKKKPRAQIQTTKLSFERFGRRSRPSS